jgi:hypothetical protein
MGRVSVCRHSIAFPTTGIQHIKLVVPIYRVLTGKVGPLSQTLSIRYLFSRVYAQFVFAKHDRKFWLRRAQNRCLLLYFFLVISTRVSIWHNSRTCQQHCCGPYSYVVMLRRLHLAWRILSSLQKPPFI